MITFRQVEPSDYTLIGEWLSHPHVARWWNQEFTAEAIERDFGPVVRGEEPAENLLALEDGVPFAHVQRCRWIDYEEDIEPLRKYVDVPDDAVTIDYLIGELSEISKGRGPQLIRAFVADTWMRYPDSNTIIVPVAAGNRPSWRALEKAGFRRIGEASLTPDNPIDPPLHYVQRLDRT
nr:GNAT family N-acetyltransferase [Rhodococcus sp. (in: high G+C Gram-positive bacteria)]